MCYSATANFVGSAVIGGVGVATLARVHRKRELLFGAVPLLFAVHQLIEGFVWLGLNGRLSQPALEGIAAAYVLYAQGLLPFVFPLSLWLLEPGPRERARMRWFVGIGVVVSLYILWALTVYHTHVFERGHSIIYDNPGTERAWLAAPYVLATCGAALFSARLFIVLFGVLNLVGVIASLIIKAAAFTSIWCAYAAVVSVAIYAYFHRQRRQERTLSAAR